MQAKFDLSSLAMPSSPYIANGQKLFHATTQLQAHAFKALMRYQIETLGFMKRRCEQDMKLMDDLASSDEFNDTFDIVSNFVQNAASEYSAEVGKFASLGSKLASETAKRVREETDQTIEDIAAATAA
ncbi:MAG: phasin family protein [Rhizobiaceae bacterium]|nr:phasin family protein [Rhizobiaceae bacterium]